MTTDKALREIEHGKLLATHGAEDMWGWGSPAGAVRARRRGMLVAQAAGLRPGVRALELGCGTGLFSSLFAQTGAQVTAIDISPVLIDIARQKVPDVDFVCDRFEDAQFPDWFDAVVGSSVLHHLELSAALKRSLDALKPGGKFAFAEPNMLNPQIFVERNFRTFFPQVSPDETAFVRWSLINTLKELGFTKIHITPFDWLHPAIPRPLIGSVSTLGGLLEKIPVVREFSGSLLIQAEKP
jgi:2-polyprenyl-3-methyl-5-hydroxy-6-metoxy-1,4-benzoquinol methylase